MWRICKSTWINQLHGPLVSGLEAGGSVPGTGDVPQRGQVGERQSTQEDRRAADRRRRLPALSTPWCARFVVPLFVALGTLCFPGCSTDSQERSAVEELMAYRTARDRHMAAADSPLTPEQRGRFKGLAYFKPDFDLVFDAALERIAPADTVRMLTTTGGIDLYLRYAHFPFRYRETTYSLTVFRPVQGEHLFLPFTDATSGNESYGAARYVDLLPLQDGGFRLDFNRAYNPYCAYNPEWACPIAPPENTLPFAVRAGERKYPHAVHASP